MPKSKLEKQAMNEFWPFSVTANWMKKWL